MNTRLPSQDDVLRFIAENPDKTTKRDIAKAFKIKGAARVVLKDMIAEMRREGLIERGARKSHRPSGAHLPPVGVIEITRINEDGEPIARPQSWDHDADEPKIILPLRKGDASIGIGDRVLAKLQALPKTDAYDYEARVIKKLAATKRILGVFRSGAEGGRVVPVDKKADREFRVDSVNRLDAKDGELVEIETLRGPRFGLQPAKVVERLGDIGAPRSISLIAIHEHGIPVEFSRKTLEEAEAATENSSMKGREDLRALPLITIDPEDARDHDDAIFAEPDPDPNNEGGHILWIAIADVAHYVRPGSSLDREARKRGNSCYFPDRVVPMLPDKLSGDLCSLHEGVERPCLGVRIILSENGTKISHSFFRAMMRSAASLSYETAQATAKGLDGAVQGPVSEIIHDLFSCYESLVKARERRQPLDLDLPERRIVMSDEGKVTSIRFRERFDAHKLVEECMVLANVCAAETLELKRSELVYRVHEPPVEERIESLRETLETIGIPLAKGQRMIPANLNTALRAAQKTEYSETVSMSVLRAQTQAYYGPDNLGHFGLNLARYAHFTSPIRRYADLIVHRALISALGLGEDPKKDGLSLEDIDDLRDTATHISQTERRAMLADRDSTDRYLAAFMENRIGAEFDGIVSGVARFGMFVKLNETGADGLIPVSTLGDEYYTYDDDARTLRGERSGTTFRMGMPVLVRLEEAAPLSGGLRFSLLEGGDITKGSGRGKPGKGGKRRPNIPKGRRAGKGRKGGKGRR
jgi:ribonuclease R